MFNFIKSIFQRLFVRKLEANPNIVPMDILPAMPKRRKKNRLEYVGGLAEYNTPPVTKEYLDYLREEQIKKIRNGFGGSRSSGAKINMSDRSYVVGVHGEWIRWYGWEKTTRTAA